MITLAYLVFAHFLCDFALQNDFVAKFKARIVDGKYNDMWVWVLLAHSCIHALAALIITKSVWLSLLMVVTHFAIDTYKCEKKCSLATDQYLHLIVILIIWGLTPVGLN